MNSKIKLIFRGTFASSIKYYKKYERIREIASTGFHEFVSS